MPQVNYKTGEILVKIVYYGPSYGGKTTSLRWLHTHLDSRYVGKLFSLDTQGDRTLFFDLLPITLGRIDWMVLKIKLYTVPGEVRYNSTRRMVLTGTDAVIFVADSEIRRFQENVDSLKNLARNLAERGRDIRKIPFVFQYNKQDLPQVLPREILDQKLNFRNFPSFGSIAIDPQHPGILDAYIAALRPVIRNLAPHYSCGRPINVPHLLELLEQKLRQKFRQRLSALNRHFSYDYDDSPVAAD